MSTGPNHVVPDVLTVRAAAAAAEAVRAVAGVARLQPTVWGVVQRATRDLWERVTGRGYPDTGGVEVIAVTDVMSGAVRLRCELNLVVDARHRADEVARAAQRAAAHAIGQVTELPVSGVAVYISEIDLGPLLV